MWKRAKIQRAGVLRSSRLEVGGDADRFSTVRELSPVLKIYDDVAALFDLCRHLR
jgi:hypothetical protein